MRDLADFLVDAGQVVGGGAALGAAAGFLAAGLARDLGLADPDPIRWAEYWGQLGAVAGIAALIFRATDLH